MPYSVLYKVNDGSLQGHQRFHHTTYDRDQALEWYQKLAKLGNAYLQSQVDEEEPELGEWDLRLTNVEEDKHYIVVHPGYSDLLVTS